MRVSVVHVLFYTGLIGSLRGSAWMRAEHSCFGFGAPPTDSLFFAVFPEPDVAPQLARIAQQQCIRHRLRGQPLAAARFHVSLMGLGKYAGLPRNLVAEALEVGAALKASRFQVTFDRALSFLGSPWPLVLCGGDGIADLIAFQRALGGAIQERGLGRVKPQYTPHVTLLYDERGIEAHAVEPVRWTVREFVLVHSLLGRTRHIALGRWRLHG